MITVSLKNFAKYALSQPSNRISVVRSLKRFEAAEYDPRKDFYKSLRESVVSTLRDGRPLTDILATAQAQQHSVKRKNFPPIARRFDTWWTSNAARFFRPPSQIRWSYGNVTVRVSPEVGIETRNGKYLSKLWFDSERPSNEAISVMLGVMYECKNSDWNDSWLPAVLDVQRGELRTAAEQDQFNRVLEGLADDLSRAWEIN